MSEEFWPPLNVTLPSGLSWAGSADTRTWTLTGSTFTMDYPESPRETLAAALLAAAGDGVNVYASPVGVVAPPAIVIRPADPYQAPGTAGGSDSAAWAFEVDIILGKYIEGKALDALERARETLSAALPAGWYWVEFGDVGEVLIGKKPYMKATLAVAVIMTEGMV